MVSLTILVLKEQYINKNGFNYWELNSGGSSGSTGSDIYISAMTFNNGDYNLTLNRNDGVVFTQNLGILASDIYLTGGTYSSGTITFTNNSGGTFSVSGFTSGMTDSYTNSATLNGDTIQFGNNIQGPNFYSVNLNPLLSGKTDNTLFSSHTANTSNPHQTSFNQLISTAHTHPISDITGLQSALNLKADLVSPIFTGTPLAPTAILGTNTDQIATTAFVTNADANNVKLTGAQTILGEKNFSNTSTFSSLIQLDSDTSYISFSTNANFNASNGVSIARIGNKLALNGSSGEKMALLDTSSITGDFKSFNFPDNSGTFALTDNPTPITATAHVTNGGTTAQFVDGTGALQAKSQFQTALTNPVTGTGVNGQVSFWNGTNTQTGDSGLFWDNTNKRLGVGAATLNHKLQINATGFNNVLGLYNVSAIKMLEVNTASGNPTLSMFKTDGTTLGIFLNAGATSYFNTGGRILFGTTTDNNVDLGQFNGSVIASGYKIPSGLATQALAANGSTIDLSNNVRGTGTLNRVSKWTDLNTQGDSQITDNGTSVWIGNISFGSAKLNLSALGNSRVLEISREDSPVTPGVTGGGGMNLSTVAFQNGTGGVFGNNILGYMKSPLESIGIRAATVPLSDTGTEPIIKLEANGSATNGFAGITTVATRPILGVYNYSTRLMSIAANGDTTVNGNVFVNTTTSTSYDDIVEKNFTLGARGATGNVPMLATKTVNTFNTGFYQLALQSANVARTGEADMLFRTALNAGGNSISELTTTGNAFSFYNGVKELVTIKRNGNLLVNTGNAPTIDIVNQGSGSLSMANGATGLEAPVIVGKSNNSIGLILQSGTNNINSNADMQFNVRAGNNIDYTTLTSTAFRFSRFGTTLIDVLRNGNTTVNGTITASQYRLSTLNTAPASATATGTLGEVRITATHIYVCIASNTWVRTTLTTW